MQNPPSINILFVCLGNICRSPLAAGIMKKYFLSAGLEGHIHSAGTEDWNVGRPPDPRSLHIAKAKGVDISGHRARQITEDDFNRFDLIFAMDRANLRKLLAMAPRTAQGKDRALGA